MYLIQTIYITSNQAWTPPSMSIFFNVWKNFILFSVFAGKPWLQETIPVLIVCPICGYQYSVPLQQGHKSSILFWDVLWHHLWTCIWGTWPALSSICSAVLSLWQAQGHAHTLWIRSEQSKGDISVFCRCVLGAVLDPWARSSFQKWYLHVSPPSE